MLVDPAQMIQLGKKYFHAVDGVWAILENYKDYHAELGADIELTVQQNDKYVYHIIVSDKKTSQRLLLIYFDIDPIKPDAITVGNINPMIGSSTAVTAQIISSEHDFVKWLYTQIDEYIKQTTNNAVCLIDS